MNPKFKVGQVVRINTGFYKRGIHKFEQYQRITRVWPWKECKDSPFGYSFINRDECNEKYLKPLSETEKGVKWEHKLK